MAINGFILLLAMILFVDRIVLFDIKSKKFMQVFFILFFLKLLSGNYPRHLSDVNNKCGPVLNVKASPQHPIWACWNSLP